ncbi:hypothetical protein Y032_0168g182 [Ancylostoma ceylanicum]|uniref:Major sperm protein n=1 Tax=Ancylostoma ceylanicum TaxID=53326 RepID=A0A016SVG8_9BILA|nr:hypothetical protein Y032_0168g182 [Ancylostoma ceylanicum]
METDDFYKLREGMDNSLDPLVNIHEMIFRPLDKLVFNAPFDFDNITYHMTILNNTKHPIAFAIKGNCIPRVIAYPPYGILKSKQKIPVAVTMRVGLLESFVHCSLSSTKIDSRGFHSLTIARVVPECSLKYRSDEFCPGFSHNLNRNRVIG